ncbi:MAG TPA: hypothetical protein VK890_09090, partial [Bacteroidia bacterium]|nr:hypothetical protein [Bacteroidia bacterium]
QADTGKPHYMYSFIAVNAGWGKNLNQYTALVDRPFWGTDGPTVNVSALIAIKESYWGISLMAGYSAPGFALSAFAPLNSDTNKYNSFLGGSAAHYNIYYALGGLCLKLPQRTTRGALELRIMLGPLICNSPNITYTTNIPQPPNFTTSMVNTTHISSFTAVAFAMCPGIGIGHKMSKHIAVMGYCDLIFTEFKYATTETNTSPGSNQTTNLHAESVIDYVNLTATVAYSFGNIKANISY